MKIAADHLLVTLREPLTADCPKVLDVADSRASKEPEVAKFVEGVLTQAFEHDEGQT